MCGNRSTRACSKAALIMVGCMLRARTGLDVSNRGCINCSRISGESGSDDKLWMSNAMPEVRLLPRAPTLERGNRPQPQSCSCTSPIPVVDFFANRLAYNRKLQSRQMFTILCNSITLKLSDYAKARVLSHWHACIIHFGHTCARMARRCAFLLTPQDFNRCDDSLLKSLGEVTL